MCGGNKGGEDLARCELCKVLLLSGQVHERTSLACGRFFCPVCQIGMTGPASYREHLAGRAHKRGVASASASSDGLDLEGRLRQLSLSPDPPLCS